MLLHHVSDGLEQDVDGLCDTEPKPATMYAEALKLWGDRHPRKAGLMAEDVLRFKPDHVGALQLRAAAVDNAEAARFVQTLLDQRLSTDDFFEIFQGPRLWVDEFHGDCTEANVY